LQYRHIAVQAAGATGAQGLLGRISSCTLSVGAAGSCSTDACRRHAAKVPHKCRLQHACVSHSKAKAKYLPGNLRNTTSKEYQHLPGAPTPAYLRHTAAGRAHGSRSAAAVRPARLS
jgi:hypothetical protein